MKKGKGFTIIELLGVLAIIAILALVIIPAVMRYIQKGKDEYNEGIKEQLVLAAKDRYSEGRATVVKTNVYDYVTAGQLSTEGYLKEELVDSEGNSCTKQSYVVAKYMKTKSQSGVKEIKYYPCMTCGDKSYMTSEEMKQCHKYKLIPYNTEGYPVCDIDTGYSKAMHTQVKITKNNINNITVRAVLDDSFVKETELTKEEQVMASLKKEHKFAWANDNFKVYLTDTNDKYLIECGSAKSKAPAGVKAKMYFVNQKTYDTYKNSTLPDSEKTQIYKGEWQDGYVYVEIENFDEFDYFTKGKDNEKLDSSWFWISKEGDIHTKVVGHYEVLSSDGTKTEPGTRDTDLVTKLDRTDPTISLVNPKNGVWTNANVTVTANVNGTHSPVTSVVYGYANDALNDSYGTCDGRETCSLGKTWSSNINKTVYVKVTDSVGRSAMASTVIKVDVEDPTITHSDSGTYNSEGFWQTSVTVYGSCSDDFSGVNSFTGSPQTINGPSYGGTVSMSCRDNAGNEINSSWGYYVAVYGNCSCSKYKRCKSCGCKEYNKKTCTGTRWKCVSPTSSAGATYEYSSCKVGNTKTTTGSVRTCTCQSYSYTCNGSCKTYKRCEDCQCETWNQCWHY